MKILSVNERFEVYLDTLQQCGMHLLEMSDEDIGYYLFEEFDVCAGSFLHENALSVLKGAGLITENVAKKSAELREKFFALESTGQWNVQSVKHANEWREILSLSDEIKSLLSRCRPD